MKEIRVIFTDIGGRVLNRVLGENWLHVLVELKPGVFYEATWPVVKKGPTYRARRKHIVTLLVAETQWRGMMHYAESQMGRRYMCRGYFFPKWFGKTRGIYCSQYACNVLRAGGVPIPVGAGYSPDKLLKALKVYLR